MVPTDAAICEAGEVVIGGKTVLGLADARTLHAGLKVGKDYTTWIKERIAKFGFNDGKDYEIFGSPNLGNQTGRGGDRRSKEYRITLRMAKHLAMVENNDVGLKVRISAFLLGQNDRGWKAI